MKKYISYLASLLKPSSSVARGDDFKDATDVYNKSNYTQAIELFRPLATKGNATAQWYLGLMYKNGEGVIQDDKETVNLYRFAAEQGHTKAQSNLGFMYAIGQGVTQDYVHAYMWCNLAASNGHKIARENLGKIAKEMTPAQIDEAQNIARDCEK